MTDDIRPADEAPDERFAFGKNWRNFLSTLDDTRIARAGETLQEMLGVPLSGKSFLDVGSGSGLFSLAARRAGARVHSFDYDRDSVACTTELRRRFYPDDPSWQVERGSVLDPAYLQSLGTFDIVYSWGVLHHTGAMRDAFRNVAATVKPGGLLFIAIYNDQGVQSRIWTGIKRVYNKLPSPLRPVMTVPFFTALWTYKSLRDLVLLRPFASYREYRRNRGMSPWHDTVDWVGGYPFEVARPEVVFDFFRELGFSLTKLVTCGGKLGCNEFVFVKAA